MVMTMMKVEMMRMRSCMRVGLRFEINMSFAH